MWDQRYAVDEYVYGTLPNDFLVSRVAALPRGRVLCLGEGEGRNAAWLAQQGFAVHAVDASAVGMEKARRLALGRGVAIATTVDSMSSHGASAPSVGPRPSSTSTRCGLASSRRRSSAEVRA